MHTSTDYLVVGAGASGLAFTDSLVAETDADVTLIDRRRAVGGHWVDAYPFVRLHIPSAYYGVNSLPLGRTASTTQARTPASTNGRQARRSASTSPPRQSA